MMGIAVGGLGVNLVSLWLLSGSHSDSLNVRGAWLHVLGIHRLGRCHRGRRGDLGLRLALGGIRWPRC